MVENSGRDGRILFIVAGTSPAMTRERISANIFSEFCVSLFVGRAGPFGERRKRTVSFG